MTDDINPSPVSRRLRRFLNFRPTLLTHMQKRLILFSIALFLLLAVIAASFVITQTRRLEREQFQNLQGIAKLKAEQIQGWLDERRADGINLMVSADLAAAVGKFRQNHADANSASFLLNRFGVLQDTYHYANVMLLNNDGEVLLANGADTHMSETARNNFSQALARKQIMHTGLYADESSNIRMDWAIPMLMQNPREPAAIAVIVLRADPRQFLYPLIESWPVSSSSAETLLAGKQGESVVYLSEPRHMPDAALRLTHPLRDLSQPAAVAVNAGQPGVMRGKDYRGVEVAAAYRPIAGADWYIIAQVDRAELLAPVWDAFIWLLGVSLVSLAAILVIVIGLFKYAKELQKNRLLSQFFELPFIGMAIICPETGKWLRTNDRLGEILGYSREELSRMTWAEIARPEERAAAALSEAALRGETDRYASRGRFTRKSGEIFEATLDIRCHRRENGSLEYFIATLDDVAEPKHAGLAGICAKPSRKFAICHRHRRELKHGASRVADHGGSGFGKRTREARI